MAKFKRIPLNVDVLFTSEGILKPKKIITKDGTFTIDRVLGIKRYCPQVVPCVAPYEYKVMVEGVEKRIYFEPHSNLWFSVKSYEG